MSQCDPDSGPVNNANPKPVGLPFPSTDAHPTTHALAKATAVADAFKKALPLAEFLVPNIPKTNMLGPLVDISSGFLALLSGRPHL